MLRSVKKSARKKNTALQWEITGLFQNRIKPRRAPAVAAPRQVFREPEAIRARQPIRNRAAVSSSKNGNSSSSTEYLVNEFSEQVQKDGYEINDITVSVMIGKPDLADQDLQKYKQAVAFAAGISQDKISVTAAQFADSSKGTGTSNNGGLWSELSKGISEKPLVFLIAIVVLAALLTVAVAVLKKKLARKRVIEEEEPDALRALLEPKPPAEDMPGQIVLNETRGQGLEAANQRVLRKQSRYRSAAFAYMD